MRPLVSSSGQAASSKALHVVQAGLCSLLKYIESFTFLCTLWQQCKKSLKCPVWKADTAVPCSADSSPALPIMHGKHWGRGAASCYTSSDIRICPPLSTKWLWQENSLRMTQSPLVEKRNKLEGHFWQPNIASLSCFFFLYIYDFSPYGCVSSLLQKFLL